MFEQKTVQEIEKLLDTESGRGLSEGEAASRLLRNGKNELKEEEKKTTLEAFLEQLNDPLICVLLAAAFLSFLLKEISDAVIISVVVAVNAIVGVIQEGKAKKALEALKKLTSPKADVRRNGKVKEIPASDLVKGDIVLLETGAQVPADLRLIKSYGLKVEESALTGESISVLKDADFLADRELLLGDRKNQVFMSTLVTGGRGEGIVVGTGMETEIGKIAAILDKVPKEFTPLQKKLAELGKVLSLVSILLCAALFSIAIFQERDILTMFLTAVSLAVAAVPEGLPAIVTIVLAMSVQRMVKVQTIIRRLPSVETLGAVNVVCTDKTGTLTQNKMEVTTCYVDHRIIDSRQAKGMIPAELLEAMVLCSDASLGSEGEDGIGDPTELALLRLAAGLGTDREETQKRLPRIREKAFDSKRKMMTTVHRGWQGCVTYSKGAPEVILLRCSKIRVDNTVRELKEADRRKIEKAVSDLSTRGLRILAFAMKADCRDIREEELTFLGMTGMMDPIRPEVKEAVARFKKASVRTVMITGDHKDTALAIAAELGIAKHAGECMTGEELNKIPEDRLADRIGGMKVFARVSPEHKMQIVKALKESGNIVAMTGDGVNDAPSLKMADIGIAMGMSGTDVAKNAADMILADDNFATIEKAIEEGRSIYENIRKTVLFLLSSNFGEIITMFAAVAAGLATPLKASHILWINLITDSLPALALGVDQNDKEKLMEEEPRKAEEGLFAHGGIACTIFYGVLIALISLAAFLKLPFGILNQLGMAFSLENIRTVLKDAGILTRAQTYTFTVLGMSQLFHASGMRDVRTSVFSRRRSFNPVMALSFFVGFLLQFAVTEIPTLTKMFGTASLSAVEWISLLILAAFPVLAHEILVLTSKEKNKETKPDRKYRQIVWEKNLRNKKVIDTRKYAASFHQIFYNIRKH